jgi:hypothetical protein
MTDTDARFEQFMTRVLERPLPTNPMSRIRTLARELAEGAAEGVWDAGLGQFRGMFNEERVLDYLRRRWDERYPAIPLLITNGYLSGVSNSVYGITEAAFALIEEAEPEDIFISYRRRDSSAFALLLVARLKAEGLRPFLDMALVPGENWNSGLQARIQRSRYFVLLLGTETLTSEVVQQELAWAASAGAVVIPIWHNGFHYESGAFNLPPHLDSLLQNTHTIRVVEENPLAYNNAIVELLNRFGVTP